jgi:hypothetical protein
MGCDCLLCALGVPPAGFPVMVNGLSPFPQVVNKVLEHSIEQNRYRAYCTQPHRDHDMSPLTPPLRTVAPLVRKVLWVCICQDSVTAVSGPQVSLQSSVPAMLLFLCVVQLSLTG